MIFPRTLVRRQKKWIALWLGVLMWLVLSLQTVPVFAAPQSGDIVALTNSARADAGLAPLQPNSRLSSAAQRKAEDMLANQYFAHTSPSGATPWSWIQGAGYSYSHAGENLALDYFTSSEVHAGWMASPGHAKNILDTGYQDIGVGIAYGWYQNRDTYLIAVMFGAPYGAPAAAAPAVAEDGPTEVVRAAPRVYPTTTIRVVDSTPPDPPQLTSPTEGTLTNAQEMTITGTAEHGATVAILENDEEIDRTKATPDFSLTVNLAEGEHHLQIIAIDAAHNRSAPAQVAFTIDRTAPQVGIEQVELAHNVIMGSTFGIKVQTAETGLSGEVIWGDNQQALAAIGDNAYETRWTAPEIESEGSLLIKLRDRAGNETLLGPIGIAVIAPFEPEIGAAGLPANSVFFKRFNVPLEALRQGGMMAILLLLVIQTLIRLWQAPRPLVLVRAIVQPHYWLYLVAVVSAYMMLTASQTTVWALGR